MLVTFPAARAPNQAMCKCLLILLLGAAVWAQAPPAAQRRGKQTQRTANKVSELETPVATFHGTLKSVTKKEIILELPEEQSIAFHISHKTKFLQDSKPIKPAAIKVGAPLTLEGKRDLLGNVEAVTVTVDSNGAKERGSGDPVSSPR